MKYCWHCGRKFRGGHFTVAVIDGYTRFLHKLCATFPDLVRPKHDHRVHHLRISLQGEGGGVNETI